MADLYTIATSEWTCTKETLKSPSPNKYSSMNFHFQLQWRKSTEAAPFSFLFYNSNALIHIFSSFIWFFSICFHYPWPPSWLSRVWANYFQCERKNQLIAPVSTTAQCVDTKSDSRINKWSEFQCVVCLRRRGSDTISKVRGVDHWDVLSAWKV